MKEVETVNNQTVMDIATQEYGNPLAVFAIIEDNSAIYNETLGTFELSEDLAVGQTLNIRTEGDIVKQKVLRDITNKTTSYLKSVTEPYLANEDDVYITDENGNKIIVS